jgi:hypothetical protein
VNIYAALKRSERRDFVHFGAAFCFAARQRLAGPGLGGVAPIIISNRERLTFFGAERSKRLSTAQ